MVYRAALTVMVVTVFTFHSSYAVHPTAGEVVKNTSTQVIEWLKSEEEELKSQPELIYFFINQLVFTLF